MQVKEQHPDFGEVIFDGANGHGMYDRVWGALRIFRDRLISGQELNEVLVLSQVPCRVTSKLDSDGNMKVCVINGSMGSRATFKLLRHPTVSTESRGGEL